MRKSVTCIKPSQNENSYNKISRKYLYHYDRQIVWLEGQLSWNDGITKLQRMKIWNTRCRPCLYFCPNTLNSFETSCMCEHIPFLRAILLQCLPIRLFRLVTRGCGKYESLCKIRLTARGGLGNVERCAVKRSSGAQ